MHAIGRPTSNPNFALGRSQISNERSNEYEFADESFDETAKALSAAQAMSAAEIQAPKRQETNER